MQNSLTCACDGAIPVDEGNGGCVRWEERVVVGVGNVCTSVHRLAIQDPTSFGHGFLNGYKGSRPEKSLRERRSFGPFAPRGVWVRRRPRSSNVAPSEQLVGVGSISRCPPCRRAFPLPPRSESCSRQSLHRQSNTNIPYHLHGWSQPFRSNGFLPFPAGSWRGLCECVSTR